MPANEPEPAPPGGSLKARSSAGVIWGMVDGVGQQVLTLAIFVILGRMLTPEIFGVVSTALVFVYLLRNTILNAVSTSLVTLRQPTDEDYNTAFCLLLAISFGAFLLLNAIAVPLSHIYEIDGFEQVVHGTSLMVLFFGLSYAHVGWARKNFRFRELALRNIVGVAAGGVSGIALALVGYGVAALVANQVVAGVVSLVLLWISIPWRPRLRANRASARQISQTALPLGLTQGLQFLVQNFDTAIVTFLIGPFGGGLYAAAKRITLAIQQVVWQPIASVSLPAFAEVQENPERFSRMFVLASSLVTAVTAPIFAAVAMVSPLLISFLFGEHWLPAAPILSILCIAGLVVPNMGLLHQIVVARRKSHWILWFTVVQIVIGLGALWAFAGSDDDGRAVALCLTAPYVVIYALTLVFVDRLVRIPRLAYAGGILKPLLASALMAAAMWAVPAVPGSVFLELVLRLAAGGVVYLAVLALIARSTFAELLSLLRIVVRRR